MPMKNSTVLAQLTKDQASSSKSDRTKLSRKRKRTIRDASLDESAEAEADAIVEPEPPRKTKKRKEHRIPRLPYPDPTIDEVLSQQSRRALLYAFERCQRADRWKFSKARQNWLLRNVWSEQAVPGSYIPLVIEYLVSIKGGAREKLIAVCASKLSASGDEPTQEGTQSFADTTDVGSTIKEQPSTSRALSILNALGENNQNQEPNWFYEK